MTKLLRFNHTYDRDSTIKHKDVNYIIKGIVCPEYQVKLRGLCWTCSELIKTGYNTDPNAKWYENGNKE